MTKKHWEYESVKQSKKRYEAAVMKTVPLRLNANTESDILEKLDSVDNKRQYIISLIRADISKEKTRE